MDTYITSINDRLALPEFSSHTEKDKVNYFSSGLSDPADLWHHSISRSSPGLLANYKTYVEAFRAYFEDPSRILRIRNEFKNLRQETSVAVYIKESKALAFQGGIEPLHQREALISGFKKYIGNELVRQKLLNAPFDEICTAAIEIELAHSAAAVWFGTDKPTETEPSGSSLDA